MQILPNDADNNKCCRPPYIDNNTNDNNKRSLIGSYRSPYSSITNLQHHLRRAQLHLDNNDNEHHTKSYENHVKSYKNQMKII